MRLYSAKIPIIARDIIRQLIADNAIEVSNVEEAQLDIESVLKAYQQRDRQITEETKDMLESRGMSHGQFSKVKRIVAEKRGQRGSQARCAKQTGASIVPAS